MQIDKQNKGFIHTLLYTNKGLIMIASVCIIIVLIIYGFGNTTQTLNKCNDYYQVKIKEIVKACYPYQNNKEIVSPFNLSEMQEGGIYGNN